MEAVEKKSRPELEAEAVAVPLHLGLALAEGEAAEGLYRQDLVQDRAAEVEAS